MVVLKVESTGFVNKLNVMCARKRRVKEEGEGTDEEFSFGHVKFEISIRCTRC